MSSKFIVITRSATEKLLQDRKIQSSDFIEHIELLNLFSVDQLFEFDHLTSYLKLEHKLDSIVVTSLNEAWAEKKDFVCVKIPNEGINPPNNLLVLGCYLKLLRFCVKYWNNLPLNNNEYIPPGSSKAIVFPYSISSGGAFRIAIEREPDKIAKKSTTTGNHIYAYKFDTVAGYGVTEIPEIENYKSALEIILQKSTYENTSKKDDTRQLIIDAYSINNTENSQHLEYLPQTGWIHYLSESQKGFVSSNASSASRIEGPAGSGKTLCLIFKAGQNLISKRQQNTEHKSLFITPSVDISAEVSRKFKYYFPELANHGSTSLEIMTLQEICQKHLGSDISESDFLDIDTLESKNTQLLYISEIIDKKKKNLSKSNVFLSQQLSSFFTKEDSLTIADLVMHEISVVIKGRCDEEYDKYMDSSRPAYGLPIQSKQDREYIFNIYKDYTKTLETLNVYDVDDIVMATISKLDSVFWRRRRKHEGYDSIYIDETHLFSFNELSIVHYLTKNSEEHTPISYAIDVAQAIGDIAWSDKELYDSMRYESDQHTTQLSSIFRCSSEIIDLIHAVTISGVSLFSNFRNLITENTLLSPKSASHKPQYILVKPGNNMLDECMYLAERVHRIRRFSRSGIALIFFEEINYREFIDQYETKNKPLSFLKKRSDFKGLLEAKDKNQFVACLAEHSGGLEFDAVILIGIDDGRVPPAEKITTQASKEYHSYTSHNKLYISMSRARNNLYLVGEEMRGKCTLLSSAISSNKLEVVSDGINNIKI